MISAAIVPGTNWAALLIQLLIVTALLTVVVGVPAIIALLLRRNR